MEGGKGEGGEREGRGHKGERGEENRVGAGEN